MIDNEPVIMSMSSQSGMVSDRRVTNPSMKPATTKNGTILIKIFRLSCTPVLNEYILEYVFGKRIEHASINPAAVEIMILNISMAP